MSTVYYRIKVLGMDVADDLVIHAAEPQLMPPVVRRRVDQLRARYPGVEVKVTRVEEFDHTHLYQERVEA